MELEATIEIHCYQVVYHNTTTCSPSCIVCELHGRAFHQFDLSEGVDEEGSSSECIHSVVDVGEAAVEFDEAG